MRSNEAAMKVLIVALWVLLGSLLVGSVQAAPTINGTFDTGVDGWVAVVAGGNGQATWVSDGGLVGGALYVGRSPDPYFAGAAYEVTDFVATAGYRLSYYYAGAQSSNALGAMCVVGSAAGAADWAVGPDVPWGYDGWTWSGPYTVDFVAGASSGYVTCHGMNTGYGGAPGSRFDQITLTQISGPATATPTPLPTATPTSTPEPTATGWFVALPVGTIVAPVDVVAESVPASLAGEWGLIDDNPLRVRIPAVAGMGPVLAIIAVLGIVVVIRAILGVIKIW